MQNQDMMIRTSFSLFSVHVLCDINRQQLQQYTVSLDVGGSGLCFQLRPSQTLGPLLAIYGPNLTCNMSKEREKQGLSDDCNENLM